MHQDISQLRTRIFTYPSEASGTGHCWRKDTDLMGNQSDPVPVFCDCLTEETLYAVLAVVGFGSKLSTYSSAITLQKFAGLSQSCPGHPKQLLFHSHTVFFSDVEKTSSKDQEEILKFIATCDQNRISTWGVQSPDYGSICSRFSGEGQVYFCT